MDISHNKINELAAIKAPNVLQLNLNNNLINKTDTFEGHPKIRILEPFLNFLIVDTPKDQPTIVKIINHQ